MTSSEDILLTRLLHLAETFATDTMIHKGMDLSPTWVLIDANRDARVVATPWANENWKSFYRATLKLDMKRYNIVAYSFVTEAWAATLDEKEWKGWARDVMPSQRIDRREIVVAVAASAMASKYKQWAIQRDDLGKVTALVSDPIRATGNNVESWLGEMLK
jgi:hypothetical protein